MCCEKENCSIHNGCVHRVPIFAHLTEPEINLLQGVILSQTYGKGDFVFQEEEQSESLFVLNEGLIKLSKVADNGKEHIIRFLFPGDFFGQFALLQEKQHYANAEVIEPAVVCQIHRNEFKPLLEQALMIGTTPETLSRKLSPFESLSLIQMNKRFITILDPPALQQLAGMLPRTS